MYIVLTMLYFYLTADNHGVYTSIMTKQIGMKQLNDQSLTTLPGKTCTEAMSIMYHDEMSLDANARMRCVQGCLIRLDIK